MTNSQRLIFKLGVGEEKKGRAVVAAWLIHADEWKNGMDTPCRYMKKGGGF